jgi:ubiquinone/menaquinone biosynthesis C-methylase UbiE
MLTRLFLGILNLAAPLKRFIWKVWYSVFMSQFLKPSRILMNYGYATLEANGDTVPLKSEDEPHRYPIQMYHHLLAATEIGEKDVLEVGCGRGGGADFTMRYMKPRFLCGIDRAKGAIDFCRETYTTAGLTFQEGDAEHLAFEDASFDVVLNVESSHCYGSMTRFLLGVKRVLRAGGYFLFADLRQAGEIDGLQRYMQGSGLEIVTEENITPNVLRSLDLEYEAKVEYIRQSFPKPIRKIVSDFSGIKGGQLHEALQSGQLQYFAYVLRK